MLRTFLKTPVDNIFHKYSRVNLIRAENARKKSCELSKHANYQSLFYVMFLLMVESCVQSKRANWAGHAN